MKTIKIKDYKIKFLSKEEFDKMTVYGEYYYKGKVNDIPDYLLEKIVDKSDFIEKKNCSCTERNTCYHCESIEDKSELELLKTKSNLEYCIITKRKRIWDVIRGLLRK